MIGQTISHYKILEKLGEGGMGVVYKAHDIELDRDVALKFLPRDVSISEEERTRFKHEAKAASALDHPNICTIYEIATTDDGQMFIAMGYYEGDSLSKKIEKGRLDVSEAVWIAIQIAEGLHAAHGKGIIHRDIKSSNIIVSDQGQVRILDFGLAHKKGLSKLTKTGTTVGTASYMSPEQAQGGKIDHRTDLWSLGVILYEMITGHLPFRGEHEAAILYSVVNEEPQPIEASISNVSPELIHIINRALEKDPAERYKTAEDMLIDLRRLRKETSRTGYKPVSGKNKILSIRNKGVITAISIVLLAVVTYLLFIKKGVEINPNFTSRWLQIPFSDISASGISPDGESVVFGAMDKNNLWDLYVINAAGGEVRRLTYDSTINKIGAANVSLNGRNVIFTVNSQPDAEIGIVPLNGGTVKIIGNGVTPKWSPDGKRIGYLLLPSGAPSTISKSGNGEFWTMNPDGTDPRLEFMDSVVNKEYLTIFFFAWSPDGNSVALVHQIKQRHCEIIIHDLLTHHEHTVVSDKSVKEEICWTTNNQLIYSSVVGDEANLWTVPASGGTPEPITKGLAAVRDAMISRDGHKLLFRQEKHTGHLWLANLDDSGKRNEIISDDYHYEFPSISPDGNHIAVVRYIMGTMTRQLFILNRDGTNIRQVTSGDIGCWFPQWSPDGKMISYQARGRYQTDDSMKVYVVNAIKLGTPRPVAYGMEATWVDSVTLEMWQQGRCWRMFLDGRSPQQFSKVDSVGAKTLWGGKYVYFFDWHQGVNLDKLCKFEDWDGIGPKNSITLPSAMYYTFNYDALYYRLGLNLYRISFSNLKTEKLKVNLEGMDSLWCNIQTTKDGKEMVYSTREFSEKLGIIENLFK